MKKTLTLLIILFTFSCSKINQLNNLPNVQLDRAKIYVEQSSQRSGHVERGRDYLIHGDFVDSGFPMMEGMNIFADSGKSQLSPFTQIESQSGITMIAPNCFQCHADSLNGEYILGLGNTHFDFTIEMSFATQFIKKTVQETYGDDSKE